METNRDKNNEVNDNVHIDRSDDVLDLDELFGVQGGVNTDEEHEHIEESCGLGCYGRNIVIKTTDNEKK